MSSFPKGTALVTHNNSTAQTIYGDCFTRPAFDAGALQAAEAPQLTAPNRAKAYFAVDPEGLPRILMVGATRSLYDLHLTLLRAIPAAVRTLSSCVDIYFHEEQLYALVILVLNRQSSEMAEAAQFVRHRWSAAKILLLESKSPSIDDWLYDDRVDPGLHPMTVREAAIRLIAPERYWIRA